MGSSVVVQSEGKKLSSAERSRLYREAMRAKGYRRVTKWVLDTKSPQFVEEYRRQLAVIAEHNRLTGNRDLIEPDEEDLKGWV